MVHWIGATHSLLQSKEKVRAESWSERPKKKRKESREREREDRDTKKVTECDRGGENKSVRAIRRKRKGDGADEARQTDTDNDGGLSLIHLSLATHEPTQDHMTDANV